MTTMGFNFHLQLLKKKKTRTGCVCFEEGKKSKKFQTLLLIAFLAPGMLDKSRKSQYDIFENGAKPGAALTPPLSLN